MVKSVSIDAYLKSVPATHRAALKELRSQVKKLYPQATEHIAYGVPLFKLDGHPLLSFRASKNHSSVFPWSSTALNPLRNKLKRYSTSAGTIRFEPDKPLPLSIVKAVLRSREREIKTRWGGKRKK